MGLLERIKWAFREGKVEYREDRPENYPRAALDEVFSGSPVLNLSMEKRNSGDGKYGLTGEDYVYKGKVTIEGFGQTRDYYVKFFFWKKDDPRGKQGIEIQSFKRWNEKSDV